MSDFEIWLDIFCRNAQSGKFDLAVLQDKFVKAGLYLEEQTLEENVELILEMRIE